MLRGQDRIDKVSLPLVHSFFLSAFNPVNVLILNFCLNKLMLCTTTTSSSSGSSRRTDRWVSSSSQDRLLSQSTARCWSEAFHALSEFTKVS